ncbi:MAG: dephospho-CoA kinase [candidate division WOR-3 bacterium]|jgi:dephospho-CoA kinase|nr:dephospho-CoA kinase [candidate division WOR-3 bacterium]MCR4424152.1 dephospho-CoA kinase [candidate division WOR-3 bacterium]MDH7519429.1 dephospho-CoA kinase [bacterium]
MFDRQLVLPRLVVGIGGNMGSGKSTVAEELRRYGARVIDADQIARNLLRKGSAEYKKVVAAFGKDILDKKGQIDRRALGRRAFSSKTSLKKLNAIMHPPIIKRIEDEIAKTKSGLLVVDAALLFSCGLDKQVDVSILVTAPDTLRLKRMTKLGFSAEEVAQRLEVQGSDRKYWSKADFVLENKGSIAELKRKVRALWNFFYSSRVEELRARKTGS